jgi:hypothetical protein
MTDAIRSDFLRFRRWRAVLADPEGPRTVTADVALAVGVLIGGGFPGAAAAVSLAAERAFPDERFIWIGDPEIDN